jgi:triosephosphate isomerase
MLRPPVIIINFKAYSTAVGMKAVRLAKICEKVARATKASIAVSVQAADLYNVSKTVFIPVLAQHIDPVDFGSHTGHVIADSVKANGAVGTLVNHSERQIGTDFIKKTVEKCKEVGLRSIVCCQAPYEAKKLSMLRPDFIAYEPPELIGGTVSVSSAKPDIIKQCVEAVGDNSRVLVGAGVHTQEDVRMALKLGAKGVLVASAVTRSKDPEKVLRDLADGLRPKRTK